MKRERQSVEHILSHLSSIESEWEDEFSDRVLSLLARFPEKQEYTEDDVREFLAAAAEVGQFEEALTVIRLFLGLSKDEFRTVWRSTSDGMGLGVTAFRSDPEGYITRFSALGVLEAIETLVHTPVTWRTILQERLRAGRGSAVKGQMRGRALENFVERCVREVFGENRYQARCRFKGEGGKSEKCDFAIPSGEDAQIVIEVKAYGATGSKLSDVLGDVERILRSKRQDTTFLLVTDGLTWHDRESDLRKLVEHQNEGRITRIYTRRMAREFEADLRQLKAELNL